MQNEVYEYMNWPRIEAVVYAEEQSPRDVMGPRITKEGVLIQGFFPDAECAAAVAQVGEVGVDAVFISIENLSHDAVPSFLWLRRALP